MRRAHWPAEPSESGFSAGSWLAGLMWVYHGRSGSRLGFGSFVNRPLKHERAAEPIEHNGWEVTCRILPGESG